MFLAVEVVVDLEEGDPSHHCLSPQSQLTMVLTASPLTEHALLQRRRGAAGPPPPREAAGDVR